MSLESSRHALCNGAFGLEIRPCSPEFAFLGTGLPQSVKIQSKNRFNNGIRSISPLQQRVGPGPQRDWSSRAYHYASIGTARSTKSFQEKEATEITGYTMNFGILEGHMTSHDITRVVLFGEQLECGEII